MKGTQGGSPRQYRLWGLAAFISYLVAEALTLWLLGHPTHPISILVADVLGLGFQGALTVLSFVMVITVGAETYVVALLRSRRAPGQEETVPEVPQGLDRSSLNRMLDDRSRNFVEVFPLKTGPLNVYAAISKEEGVEGYRYLVIEPELTPKEKRQFAELKDLLIDELDVDLRNIETREKAEAFLTQKVDELARTYRFDIPRLSMRKLQYFFARDFTRLGKIEPLMLDPLIEDISCDGAGIPLYVWHRDYESIPTNLAFDTDKELDTFVSKLAYVSGKHISLAAPLVDASLTDGSRLHLTYGKEVTQKGSTFTIRKFKSDPLTIVDLIKYNTLNAEVAAYLWYIVEKRLSMLVAGGTASGKSVPGETEVLVYRKGGKQLERIDRLYEEAAGGRNVVREGIHDVAPVDGWKTAAFGSDLRTGSYDVKSVVRHAAPKSLFRLSTRTGREVTTTGDHSVFTLVSGEVRPFPVSELGPGMFVAVPRVIPEPSGSPDSINLIEALKESDGGMYVDNAAGLVEQAVRRLGVKAVAAILGLEHRTVSIGLVKDYIALRVEAVARLAEAADVHINPEELRVRPKTRRNPSITAALRLNKGLMRLLGYWVSEGMYQDQGISLFQGGEEIRADMAESVGDSLGLKLKPSRGSDKTRLDLNSSVVRVIFERAFGLKGGSANKAIPDIVLLQRNELLSEFLRAYYTGDGWARTYVEASTKSCRLAGQLQYALGRFGMVGAVRPKIVNGQRYYSVFLYGQPNLRRFAETIGFTSEEKQSMLVDYATRPIAPHTNIDTIPTAASLMKEALQFRSGVERKELWSDWHSYWSTDKKIGRQALLRFLEATGAKGAVGDRLRDLAFSDIYWDEVVSVEGIPCTEEYVYDLEVPEAQNFVGGTGGLFLHNTTSLNTLSMFITPGQKVISIEDTAELRIPQENWIQEVSRGEGTAGEISLFDLVRNALRQRADVIIVGEIRGKEAFTLFQAISTGHGGYGTIHADSVEAVFNRLTTAPMSLPRSLVGSSLDCIVLQLKLKIGDRSVRRVVSVNEILGFDSRTNEMVMNEVYRWDPITDRIAPTGRSRLMDKIFQRYGIRPEEARRDLEGRKVFLEWLASKNYRSYKEVSAFGQEFYGNPYAMTSRARTELEARV